jgi:3-phosphoshikimate 1-carboxyvinyltransferase
VKNLKSIPYIQMTLDILNHFGISIDHNNFETFWISGNQKPKAQGYHVEGDWSGAAFHLVGAAISGEIKLLGLNPRSSQADRKILEALQKSGAEVLIGEDEIQITKKSLQSFDFDATNCPDLFPPLAVLASCCSGESRIRGVSRLEHKESNRARSIRDEFAKLNIEVLLDGDVMRIQQADVIGGLVNSQNDHRIAMAAAILASVSSTSITIENARAVNKSYPTFFDELQNIWD